MSSKLPTNAEIDSLLAKLDAGTTLSTSDVDFARTLIRSLAAATAALDEANSALELHLKIATEAQDAADAAREGVLNGLQMLAPPAATVDIDQAMKDIQSLRANIQKGSDVAQVVASVAKFAVAVAGKFV